MADNAVTLVGSLGQDPEERSGPRGGFAAFSIAVTSRYQDANGAWIDGATSWFDVKADGALGRNVLTSLRKGHRVLVHGSVGIRDTVGKDGQPRRYVQVQATSVGLDLKFGTASFTRSARRDGEGAQQPLAAQPPQQQFPAQPAVRPEQPVRTPEPVGVAQPSWSAAFTDEEDTPF